MPVLDQKTKQPDGQIVSYDNPKATTEYNMPVAFVTDYKNPRTGVEDHDFIQSNVSKP
jgi:hypothetical protein